MNTKVKQETHAEFQRRMVIEINELRRALRDVKYERAASLTKYILSEIQDRRRD